MSTWHIHIGGLVQGVGFRPFVCRAAGSMGISGQVSNGNDGVHILFNAGSEEAQLFYSKLLQQPPANALIRSHNMEEVRPQTFSSFRISESDPSASPDLLLTPDIAICPQCLQEIRNPDNRRALYPFTTCLECGPRYSISTALPYDRCHTTMADLPMCMACEEEYNDIHDRRHFSQTNSCPDCAIPMHLFDNNGVEITKDPESILLIVNESLRHGHIIAVKGIGGYLLICDATKYYSVSTLRERKHRPAKPFALLYPSAEMIAADVHLSEKEKKALQSKQAPIVLCTLKDETGTGICTELIAPGLDKIGVMLPYTALLALIMDQWNKPLVATSGNLSGSPIIYTDEDALLWLSDFADFIISYDREIITPQDDSVIQFTRHNDTPVILRRSRGMAPNYYPPPFSLEKNVLAMGAELKSAFALNKGDNLFVSQYLGDQEGFESQSAYEYTLSHLLDMLQMRPAQILADSHPGYYVTQKGRELAEEWKLPLTLIQHHKAHFAAVLAENGLLGHSGKILGVIWDGTGYGEDEQVWGGEFFLLYGPQMERYCHLSYFPHLLNDKMSKEPRISAVSLLRKDIDQLMTIRDLFSPQEREFYLKLLQQPLPLSTSSMGRLLDGIAAILRLQSFNSYEGEAAMKLEVAARKCTDTSAAPYPVSISQNQLDWAPMIAGVLQDQAGGLQIALIARKVFLTLVEMIRLVAQNAGVKKIACSGGVFQNTLLIELLTEHLGKDYKLYFHRELSPNDECIGFGQLAYFAWEQHSLKQQARKALEPDLT